MSNRSERLLTLCLPLDGSRILLGMKKRGFGSGRWNGFGGKVELGETVEDAARRELREEAGIEAGSLEPMGRLKFVFRGDPVALDVRVFRVDGFDGDPVETEEMAPRWFDVGRLPFDEMWADDRHWFPLFLGGRRFEGEFHFDGDIIVRYELRELVEV